MQYLLLIYANEAEFGAMSEGLLTAMANEYADLTRSIRGSGHWLGSSRLDSAAKATTVRVRNNKKLITDGPFAETKEQLGGFYLIEAADLDEALRIAGRVPGARRRRTGRRLPRSMRFCCGIQPSPVIELNRAVAVAMAEGPAEGLKLVDALEATGDLSGYYLLPAVRGDFLRRLARWAEAETAYRRALRRAGNAAERKFLAGRLAEVEAKINAKQK